MGVMLGKFFAKANCVARLFFGRQENRPQVRVRNIAERLFGKEHNKVDVKTSPFYFPKIADVRLIGTAKDVEADGVANF